MIKYYYIYKITSPSGKVYIGQTRWIKTRISNYKHQRNANQPLIYASIKKYGWDAHTFEIVLEGNYTQTEINHIESTYIKVYKDLKCSLNVADGGYLATHRLGLHGKPVLQFDIDGNFIKEWACVADIKRALDISAEGIAGQCRKQKNYYKGFLWAYKEDCINEDGGITSPIRTSNKMPVMVFNTKKELIYTFDSISEACRVLNVDSRDVSHAIKLGHWYKKLFYVKEVDFSLEFKIPNYGVSKEILYTDDNGIIHIFKSVTEAAIFLNMNIASIIYYASGKSKKRKYNLRYTDI